MRLTLSLLVLAANLSAAPLGGPNPGFVLDARTGTLRAVLGIPGAMQLGAPLALPFQAASADFDLNGNFAIVISTEQPAHLYFVQNLATPAITDLGAVAAQTSILAINSKGQTAAIASPGQVQFLTGLATTPALGSPLSTQPLLGPISAAVVDDAGQCLLLGTTNSSLGALETLCADGSSQRLLTQPNLNVSALSLANQGQDALLADTAGQQVLRVSAYAQSATVSTLANAASGIASPIGIQVSGQQALVADSTASCIFVIDLTGQSPIQAIALNTAPARLKFLADRSVALLTDPVSAPFTILDLQSMQSFFIPTN